MQRARLNHVYDRARPTRDPRQLAARRQAESPQERANRLAAMLQNARHARALETQQQRFHRLIQ